MTADTVILKTIGHLFPGAKVKKVYPLIAPEHAEQTAPYAVYNPSVSFVPTNTLDGYTGHDLVRIQIDVYDKQFKDCKNLAAKVVWLLDELDSTQFIGNTAMHDAATNQHRRKIQFYMWQTTPNNLNQMEN